MGLYPPLSLSGKLIEYTLTAPPVSFVFDAFQQNPAWCDITYTYSFSSPSAELVLLDFNEATRQFTFEYSVEDLAPLEGDFMKEFQGFELAIKG